MKKVTENNLLSEQQKKIYSSRYSSVRKGSTADFETEAVYQKTIERELTETFLFNTLYDDITYGKVDKEKNIITPNPLYLSPLNFVSGNKYALSFVVDAYKKLFNDWNRLIENGSVVADKKIDVVPKDCYVNFEVPYRKEIYNCYTEFVEFTKFNKLNNTIVDLPSFINNFSKFLPLYLKNNPLFVTDFIISKRCSHLSTGLVIQLNNTFSSYKEKNLFISSNSFQIFTELCYLNGFIIEKNNPSKLFFDINSEHAKKYINKYFKDNESFEQDFYKKFFIKVEDYNLLFLKNYTMLFYNFFVDQEPITNLKNFSSCDNIIKTKITKVTKTKISSIVRRNTIEDKGNYMWWKFYIFLYLCKEKININQAYFENLVFEIANLSSSLDEESALWYLKKKIADLPRSSTKERSFSY